MDALQVLIENGADVNAQNRIAGMTPLHCAIRGTFQSFKDTHPQRLECIQLLLEAGADPNLCDLRGNDGLSCIDDMMKEAQLRGLGSIESEAREMRLAIEGAGVKKSVLLACIETFDVNGVKELLSEVNGKEWIKGLVSAVDTIQSSLDTTQVSRDEGSMDDTAVATVVEIM